MIQFGAAASRVIARAKGRWRRVMVARAYRRVFADDDGTLVLHDLMRRGGVLRVGFDLRPGMTEWNEGRRSLALEILRLINLTERDFARMTEEMTDDERLDGDE